MKINELTYISNILSLTRIVLAAPIYYFLEMRSPTGTTLAVASMLLAALTDLYDGRLARRLKQKSDFGRIVDPVADKVCVGLIALALVRTRDLPLWYLGLTVFRDFGIMILSLFIIVRTQKVAESNLLGKITVSAISLTLLAYTMELRWVKDAFLWVSSALLVASAIVYFIRMVEYSKKVA